jgi:hypothetical protein
MKTISLVLVALCVTLFAINGKVAQGISENLALILPIIALLFVPTIIYLNLRDKKAIIENDFSTGLRYLSTGIALCFLLVIAFHLWTQDYQLLGQFLAFVYPPTGTICFATIFFYIRWSDKRRKYDLFAKDVIKDIEENMLPFKDNFIPLPTEKGRMRNFKPEEVIDHIRRRTKVGKHYLSHLTPAMDD